MTEWTILAAVTVRPNGIQTGPFGNLPLVIRNIGEQHRWARCGNAFMEYARLISHLIDAKCAFRRALVQRLLAGQNRLLDPATTPSRQTSEFGTVPADWSVVCIGEIAKEINTRGPIDGNVEYSCTKHEGLVPSLEYFGKQVFSRNLAAYKRVETGDFAYATNHIEEGSIGLLREGQSPGLVSPMYTVFRPTDRVNREFLFALLKTESYRRVFAKRTNASVNRRGSLRWKDFARIKVGLPSRETQDRITDTLGLVDLEIRQLSRLGELIDTQKRALLCHMLSDEIFVPA